MPRHLQAGFTISQSNPLNLNRRVATGGADGSARLGPTPGGGTEPSCPAPAPHRRHALALHHLQPGIEFMAAPGAAHTVALDRPLFAGHRHAAAVRTAS